MIAKAASLTALFACVTFGQGAEVDKVFHFANANTPQEMQETLNLVRSITEIRQAAVSAEARTMALRGTSDQVDAADWLFHAVDKPAGVQGVMPLDYRMNVSSSPVVRVYYLSHAETPQNLQELINTLRSIAEIQRVVGCTSPRAIVVRTDASYVALADWLIKALDVPGGIQKVAPPPNFEIKDAYAPVGHVAYLTSIDNPQSLQETVNIIRSISELQRVVVNTASNAIAMRGTENQVKMAEWMVQELDRADGPGTGPHEFHATPGTQVTRIFFVPNVRTAQAMQELVNQIRTITNAQRVVASMTKRAVVMKGAPEQLASAERLIQENEKPAQ